MSATRTVEMSLGAAGAEQVAAGTERTQTAIDESISNYTINFGPQHPAAHGVLRLILELEGETVKEARCGIGYLHTGIEKNMEYRTWVQGTTFCTRMDYLSPFYNEATYAFGVERLLDIEDEVPEKAQVLRVLMMELNRSPPTWSPSPPAAWRSARSP